MAARIVILSMCFTVVAEAFALEVDGWLRLKTPRATQTSQLDAGYPMGCQIATLFYAFKMGPPSWKAAYRRIPGSSDLQKIKSLAARFSLLPSRHSKGQPAFSERWGSDPNDLPWMFRSLVPSESEMELLNLVNLSKAVFKPNRLDQFRAAAQASLRKGKPVLAQLYFSEPDKAHAVLITGIRVPSSSAGETEISILDPLTGNESLAVLSSGPIVLVGDVADGISLFAPGVATRTGVLLSVVVATN